MLRNNVLDERMKLVNKQVYLERVRLRKAFNGFRKITRGLRIFKPMGHRMQLICATILIKSCFHHMMQQVWADFPDQRIDRISEVANGKVDLVLPNYLKVSKTEKY